MAQGPGFLAVAAGTGPAPRKIHLYSYPALEFKGFLTDSTLAVTHLGFTNVGSRGGMAVSVCGEDHTVQVLRLPASGDALDPQAWRLSRGSEFGCPVRSVSFLPSVDNDDEGEGNDEVGD